MSAAIRLSSSVVLASLILSACDGSPSDPFAAAPYQCASLGGGAASIQQSCINCPQNAVQNPALAIDGALDTAATISLYNQSSTVAGQSQISLRATAQAGIVFAAGSRAGLLLTLPQAEQLNYSATVTTYLDGQPQETLPVTTAHTGAQTGATIYAGFDRSRPTSLPFDSVEVLIAESAPGLEEHRYQVIEFCGDGGLR